MKIEYRVENKIMEFDLTVDEIKEWLNIAIETEDDEKTIQKKAQEAIDSEYNRPEYNNWHKQDRHRGEIESKDDEHKTKWKGKGKDKYCEKVVNEPEDVYEHALHKEVFNKYDDEYTDEQGYEFCCDLIRQSVKPNIANIVIAIMLDGYKAQEVAEMLGDTPNNISHKYNRAKDKLSKVLDKNVLLNIL